MTATEWTAFGILVFLLVAFYWRPAADTYMEWRERRNRWSSQDEE